MVDISLLDDFVVTKNHGTKLRFSSMWFDAKAANLIIIYEMHDGTDWLGPKVTVKVGSSGAYMVKLDGTQKKLRVEFSDPIIQALFNTVPINAFLNAQGEDLRTEPKVD